MIFIVARFPVKPEDADHWLDISREFTEATRAEPGCQWFDWSRSVDDPHLYVLCEGFTDDGAAAHVNSDHFRRAQQELPPHLQRTPDIISEQISADGWSELGELRVD